MNDTYIKIADILKSDLIYKQQTDGGRDKSLPPSIFMYESIPF